MLISDYQAIAKNQFLQATVWINYWQKDGTLVEKEPITGFMTHGFNRSFSNDFSDLLEETSAQASITKFLGGMNVLKGMFGANTEDSVRGSEKMYSVLQSIQLWKTMSYPPFSVTLLFFNSTGSSMIREVARKLELTQIPYADYLGDSSANMTLRAPSGYSAGQRDTQEGKNPNKRFSLTARGLSMLRVGGYALIDELLLTGVSNDFSDIMLNTGEPLFLKSTLTFKYWRLPEQENINNSYLFKGDE